MHPLQCRTRVALFEFLLILSVTACGGGSGSGSNTSAVVEPSAAQKIAQLESTGALPQLDRSADIQGPDSNRNGIRDDIDTIVQARYTDPKKRQAVVQYSVVTQAELLVDVSDPIAVKALSVRSARASNCLALQFGTTQFPRFSDVSSSISAYTANTKARKLAQLAYFKALDGTVISLPEGNTCE